jgi:hypothetical protein
MTKLFLLLSVALGSVLLRADCGSFYQGAWDQEKYNGREDKNGSMVITDLKNNCDFTGTLDAHGGFAHDMTGTIGDGRGGSVKIVRTGPDGCVAMLYGRMYKVVDMGRPLLGVTIATSDGKCGLPTDMKGDTRIFHKAGG